MIPKCIPDTKKITVHKNYLDSLRRRKPRFYLFGEMADELLDHPMIWPFLQRGGRNLQLGFREPELASVISPLTDEPISHFCIFAKARTQNRLAKILAGIEIQENKNAFGRRIGRLYFPRN